MLGNANFPLDLYPKVTLTPCQFNSGEFQAMQRDAESRRFGFQDRRGLTTNQTQYSLYGSLAEVAAHVYLGLPFSYSINKWNECDLITQAGAKFDVKAVQGVHVVYVCPAHVAKDYNFLFTHSKDNHTFYMLGYLANKEVAEYPLRNPGNRFNADGSPALCFVVPTIALHPVPAPKGKN